MKKEITIQLCLLGASLLIMLVGIFFSSPMRAVHDERLLALLEEEIATGVQVEPESGTDGISPPVGVPSPPVRETTFESPAGERETTY